MSASESKYLHNGRHVCKLRHPVVAGVIARSEAELKFVAQKVFGFPSYQTWRSNPRDGDAA